MAVYTDVSEDELSSFLSSYNIGPLLSCKGIVEGVENSNFLLHTQNDTYILTLYEKRINEKDLPFFFGLMQHLAGKGIVCPKPIAAKDGTVVSRLAGRPAAMITFLEGVWIRKPSVSHCRSVGAVLAQLHLAGADFQMRHENSLSVNSWRSLWNMCRMGADTFFMNLSAEIDQELDKLESLWPADLPVGIIHADLFPDNIFFLGEKLSGLIDFYFACNDALAYDIAICLNAWCFEKDGSFNLTKSSAMLSGYCHERLLTSNELVFLPLLARGAAMRFFLTRLYDWFFVPENDLVIKKNPMEYLKKLRFFRQIRQVSELGISMI
ncbi:MAG: homoserine kinase type II [Candidatus Tokpelaia sp. JSC188]|nr:MAG: homoserine kinase type II [Candidatus Tokpelaia sp. JSC188]